MGRKLVLLSTALVALAAVTVMYFAHVRSLDRYRARHWNCVSDVQLAQAQLSLSKADKSIRQKKYSDASSILKTAVADFPYRYAASTLDDSGMYLQVAEYEEKNGHLEQAVVRRRDLFEGRIQASTTPTSSGCSRQN